MKRCQWVRPPHHNSDHRALVVKIGGKPGGVKKYVRQRLDIPAKKKTPPIAEQTDGEKMFETPKAKM